MENKLKLPKAFAEKWFEALLSGKYQQGLEYLKISTWDEIKSIPVNFLN